MVKKYHLLKIVFIANKFLSPFSHFLSFPIIFLFLTVSSSSYKDQPQQSKSQKSHIFVVFKTWQCLNLWRQLVRTRIVATWVMEWRQVVVSETLPLLCRGKDDGGVMVRRRIRGVRCSALMGDKMVYTLQLVATWWFSRQ